MGIRTEIHPGTRYGSLTVLSEQNPRIRTNGKPRRILLCKCDCGTEKEIMYQSVSANRVVSCGCHQRHVVAIGKHSRKHGLSSDPLFSVWRKMIDRCHNKKHKGYGDYGARGIYVCEEWRSDPTAFVQWGLRNGFKVGLQLDRRDNNKGYSPDNCRWVTIQENSLNKRNTVLVNYQGTTMPLMEVCRNLSIEKKYSHLRKLLKSGKDITNLLE